jgi:hypothetical protein
VHQGGKLPIRLTARGAVGFPGTVNRSEAKLIFNHNTHSARSSRSVRGTILLLHDIVVVHQHLNPNSSKFAFIVKKGHASSTTRPERTARASRAKNSLRQSISDTNQADQLLGAHCRSHLAEEERLGHGLRTLTTKSCVERATRARCLIVGVMDGHFDTTAGLVFDAEVSTVFFETRVLREEAKGRVCFVLCGR